MRPWKPHHVQDDPPKDPEIHRWFQALGPPPVGQVPPDLRANVRARIEQQRARRGVFASVPYGGSPAWAAALVTVLIVSLGLNVWLGILNFGPRSSGELDRPRHLRTYQFQARMMHTTEVGTLLAAHPVHWDPTTIAGFIPQAARTAFFQMGTLYTDALAALHGGAVEAAEQRLDILTQILVHVQAPPALPQYLRATQTWLRQRQFSDEISTHFLALFEPLYEDAYTKANTAEAVTLFRAGAWLENMSLAAAVSDRAALRRGSEMIEEVRRTLAQLHAPPEVLRGLQQLHALVTRQGLTDQDVQAFRVQVQDIQRMFSE